MRPFMPSRRLALLSITLAVAALSGCKTTPVIETPAPVTPILAPEPKKIKIGLALGGGAARGFAPVSYTHLTLPTKRIV